MPERVKYHCTHCGRRFEAEERDGVECPGCFWSTSVEKDEVPRGAPSSTAVSRKPAPVSAVSKSSARTGMFRVLLLILLLAGLVYGLVLVIRSGASLPPDSWLARFSGKSGNGPAVHIEVGPEEALPPAKTGSAPSSTPVLTDEDRAVLERRIEVDPGREPDDEEEKILAADAPFETGLVVKLPSQAWTLENFEELLAEQEKFYKIPLPRSYKKKLEQLFQLSYLPAGEAFMTGKLLEARDGWVTSLAYPEYSNDINRQRGVALTMLRPFTNDTLSKIGALNTMIVEKDLRGREQEIIMLYQKLRAELRARNWSQAVFLGQQIRASAESLENLTKGDVMAPVYPPIIRQIDPDIARALVDLLRPQTPAIADLRPLLADTEAKVRVAESFLPEKVAEQDRAYQRALREIENQDWETARRELAGILFPASLVRDAREKIQVLEKMKLSAQAFPGRDEGI